MIFLSFQGNKQGDFWLFHFFSFSFLLTISTIAHIPPIGNKNKATGISINALRYRRSRPACGFFEVHSSIICLCKSGFTSLSVSNLDNVSCSVVVNGSGQKIKY